VASYSCGIAHKPYSDYKNHEYPDLLHFGVLIGSESKLPLYYTQLPAVSMNTKILNGLIEDWKAIAPGKLSFVIDRDFYDEHHINYMLASHIKFLMVVKTTVPFVQKALDRMRDEVRRVSNFRADCRYYGCSKTILWESARINAPKPAPGGKSRKLYLHLFYSDEKAIDDERAFYSQINAWKQEIESGNRLETNERAYARYFRERKVKNRKVRAMANLREIEKVKKDFGYSTMISNTLKDPFVAMKTHLKITLAENSFENLKDRFTWENSLIRKNKNFEGAMFVEFIAFILMSYLKNKIETSKRLVHHTMQELLDQLDFIECCEQDGKRFIVGELTERQLEIYESFSVNPPEAVLHLFEFAPN
jgi:transposase